jgi:hypothetical protein
VIIPAIISELEDKPAFRVLKKLMVKDITKQVSFPSKIKIYGPLQDQMEIQCHWICHSIFDPEFTGNMPSYFHRVNTSPALAAFCKKALRATELFKAPALPMDKSLKYSEEAMAVVKANLLSEIIAAYGVKIEELKAQLASGELYLNLNKPGEYVEEDEEDEYDLIEMHLMGDI